MFDLNDVQKSIDLNAFFMKTSINSIYLCDKLIETIMKLYKNCE